jgi:protein-disulfide isomerase
MQTVAPKLNFSPRFFGASARTTRALGVLTVVALLVGCRQTEAAPKSQTAQPSSTQPDIPEVLATIGDEKVTIADLRPRAGDQLDQLETQYHLAKSKIVSAALDSVIRERTLVAEAKKQGKTLDDLVAAEAGAAGLNPSDVEVATWYKDNPERVGTKSLDQIRPQIADYLRGQRRLTAEAKLEARIRSERKVTVSYQPFRLQFANEGAPTFGKKDAPVTLVEFSDFQCPYCQRMAPSLKQVEKKFGDQVEVVYRQFPLTTIHPFAFKAAEASLCANEQGKFWELHDMMFEEQTKIAVADLKEKAARLGLDQKKFNACLDSGRYVEQIQNDQKEGQRVGISGTPAVFLNGRLVDGGSVPYSVLETAIEKELARVKPGR